MLGDFDGNCRESRRCSGWGIGASLETICVSCGMFVPVFFPFSFILEFFSSTFCRILTFDDQFGVV